MHISDSIFINRRNMASSTVAHIFIKKIEKQYKIFRANYTINYLD